MLKKILLGISVLPALAIMPAMADGLNWWYPSEDIESYTVINGDVNSVLNGGTYNIITGTGMRNIVNGNVTLTLNGVTQEVVGDETNVFGILFLPSESPYLSLADFPDSPTELTDEQKMMQMYVNGDVNLNVYNSTIGQSVVGVNFYANTDELINSGLSGKVTVTVDNSTVDYSVRGVNYRDVSTTVAAAHVGDIEINVNNSLIKEEIVSAGSAASAGNVVINVTGDTVIGYTELGSDITKGDGWIIAGANRKGATIQSTEVNLNTAGLIRIAGDVNVGSRDRTGTTSPDTDENSVIGDATLNMFGGGTINIGGDLRAYHVGGKTTLNIGDIVANIGGHVANEFQEINMSETAALNVDGTFAMTSDGVLNMTLLSPDSYSQITANAIDANGAALNFTVSHEGTYEVLDFDELVSDFTWGRENALYNLLHEEGTGIITAELKSIEDIAADNNLTNETAHTVAMLAESSSDQLNNLAISVQNSLANGDTGAVEHVHRAIHPETESVVQSVSTSVQNSIANLVAGRMSFGRVIGRSGGATPARNGVWVEGLYNKSKHNDAFNGYTRGIVAGIDTQITRGLMLGLGYSYAHSDVSATARNTEIDSNTIFAYGQYKPAAWYVNTMLNYTMSDYTEKSDVLGVALSSDFDVDAFGAQVMTGYDFANGITPEIGLRYMHISADEYENSLGLKSKLDDADYLTGVLGAKYAFDYRVSRGFMLRPELRGAVKYDMLSDKQVATITMPGINSYVLNGNRLSRMGAEFGAGLVMKYQDFSLALNYDIEVREDYTSQTGRIRARLVF